MEFGWRGASDYRPIAGPPQCIKNDTGKLDAAPYDFPYRSRFGSKQDHKVLDSTLLEDLTVDPLVLGDGH